MKTPKIALIGLSILTSIGLLSSPASAVGSSTTMQAVASAHDTTSVQYRDHATCVKAGRGHVGCLAIRRNFFVNGIRQHALAPMTGSTLGAIALRHAYRITALGARRKVIAIVDAMHSASAYDDMVAYRKMYSLPAITNCGTPGKTLTSLPADSNPCFVQLNQDGVVDHSTLTTDSGWAQEIALDVEMASAVCPHCSILLVEARSTSFADLNASVATAAGFDGVAAISNSYGGPDTSSSNQPAFAAAAAKGIAVVASSGDSGYGVSAPASFPEVVGVGGTTLTTDSTYRWVGETAWNSGGSGCSRLNPPAAWQNPSVTQCNGKNVVDVAAVADPATGVAVTFEGQWYTFGGTSASAPIVASLFAMKSNFGASAGQFLWANRSMLHDVTAGADGSCIPQIYCEAGVGYDGPTGWGTPFGTGAF
jgi:subtilase family serine protease